MMMNLEDAAEDLQEGRNSVAEDGDHLKVGERVDGTHVETHDGQHESEGRKHLAERNDEHAQRK